MTINPPDAVVAARSFPRRWRALFARAAGNDEQSDVLARSRAVELANDAVSVLHRTADRLGPGTSATYGEDGPLDLLRHAALRLASTIETVNADDWAGERIEALTSGIDEAARLLRRAEAAVEEARRAR